MSQHRYRQKKVKREHSIIEGLLPVLERIASLPGVQSVTPGRISPRSRPGSPGIRFQYITDTGLKLLGRSNAAVQEVFVVTDEPERVLERLRAEGMVEAARGREAREVREVRETQQAREARPANAGDAAPGPARQRARRQRKAARPVEARPPQPPKSVWSEILERHQRLLELEQRLGVHEK